ncbi:MAG: helix-turn-helix domain-containing protein [Halanaerobiales bacterium]|nr:helix-turn-helix domain-containing protein [Halanaerobiales bacterium]
MQLTENLGQKIVEKTMNVLGRNINIMDQDAIIVGSGDKKRINTFHEIAAHVIKTGKTFIIKEKDVDQFKGVKTGINLPIKFNDNIIGVVGITGKVDEVRDYGEIVKNLVELMLQQEFLLREFELENKMRENFYQQLLNNKVDDKESLKERVKLLKIDPTLSRVVLMIKVRPFDNKLITNQLRRFNNYPNINNLQDIFFIRGENLVLIKSFETSDSQKQNKIIMELANRIEADLNKSITKFAIGIGQIFVELEKLYLSFRGAKNAIEVGEKIYINAESKIYSLNHLGYDYFLPFIDPFSIDYYFSHLFDQNIFAKEEIGQILESLVNNNLNISKAASEFFVHRNTLLYKLDKIKKKTGLDPKNAKDLFTLIWTYRLFLFSTNK